MPGSNVQPCLASQRLNWRLLNGLIIGHKCQIVTRIVRQTCPINLMRRLSGHGRSPGYPHRPYPVNTGSAPDGPCFVGCRPHPLWAMPQTPLTLMGFGADGPKKRAGCGVHPRSAKPTACLNRIGTIRIYRTETKYCPQISVALYGRDETVALIRRALVGEGLSAARGRGGDRVTAGSIGVRPAPATRVLVTSTRRCGKSFANQGVRFFWHVLDSKP